MSSKEYTENVIQNHCDFMLLAVANPDQETESKCLFSTSRVGCFADKRGIFQVNWNFSKKQISSFKVALTNLKSKACYL